MLIFIHGEDTFRSREKLHELILEFKKKRDPQGFNVVRLDGGELTWERFRHEALSPGFLAPKRMIVIERLLARGKKETGRGQCLRARRKESCARRAHRRRRAPPRTRSAACCRRKNTCLHFRVWTMRD